MAVMTCFVPAMETKRGRMFLSGRPVLSEAEGWLSYAYAVTYTRLSLIESIPQLSIFNGDDSEASVTSATTSVWSVDTFQSLNMIATNRSPHEIGRRER